MTAREFLDGFSADRRLTTGGYYSQEPVVVEPGDTVGVVLMNHGGPASAEAVEPFLFNQLMDPAAVALPVPAPLRERLSRSLARRRAARARKGYEQIGGRSPLTRHAEEQAHALEGRLNDRFGPLTGARFRAYTAMRYAEPTCESAVARMRGDGVTRVVLLPLHPHYSRTTTGSSLVYWRALEDRGAMPPWATTFVYEYSAHPKYVQALSERIDEGLQRFPETVRGAVRLVFTAQGTPQRALTKHGDPYCCLVHTTVQRVMALREGHDAARPFHVSFRDPVGFGKGLGPRTRDALEELAEAGHAAVLLIPVASVCDHVETAYVLDIALREEAVGLGIEHYEVTSGLNCHPLFIEALAECVAAQVAPVALSRGDGADGLPAAVPMLPRYAKGSRSVRCAQCPYVTEAHDWSSEPAVHVPAPVSSSVPPSSSRAA
jgi:ferrochelatase